MRRIVLVVVLLITGVSYGAEPQAEQASVARMNRAALQAFAKAVEFGDDALTLLGERYRLVGDQLVLDRASNRPRATVPRRTEPSPIQGSGICLIVKPVSCRASAD